jgi:MoxR-like ATPase
MEEQNANIDIRAINEKIEKESAFIDLLTAEMNKVIVGQNQMIDRLLIGLLGNGHILLEGVPGLAKTLAINTLSKAVDGYFFNKKMKYQCVPQNQNLTKRIQVKSHYFYKKTQ